jgi:hypothetical protein
MLNSELNHIIKKLEQEQQIVGGMCLSNSLLNIAREALVEYSHILNDEAAATVPFDLEGRLISGYQHER